MIDPFSCGRCKMPLVAAHAVAPYGEHWICHSCRAVYVMEHKTLIRCNHPDEHVENPPWWAMKKKNAATPAQPEPRA